MRYVWVTKIVPSGVLFGSLLPRLGLFEFSTIHELGHLKGRFEETQPSHSDSSFISERPRRINPGSTAGSVVVCSWFGG